MSLGSECVCTYVLRQQAANSNAVSDSVVSRQREREVVGRSITQQSAVSLAVFAFIMSGRGGNKTKTRKQHLKKMWEARKRGREEEKREEREEKRERESGERSDQRCQPSTSDSPVHPSTSTHSPTPKVGAAKRKQELSVEMGLLATEEVENEEYLIVKKGRLLQWARSIARCSCGKKMKVKEGKTSGMVANFSALCSDCKSEKDFTASGGGNKERYHVHQQLVKSTLWSGNGYAGVTDLFVALNMHPLSERGYYKIAQEIEEEGIKKLESVMEKTRACLHEQLKKNGDDSEVKDIYVSCDGSWSKRGFTAKYGFISVIEMSTGYCVDFVVLSKYCKTCSGITDGQVPVHECTKNFHGSSPAMEVEGWKQLWGRSVAKCNFRYLKVVSDGDSKGIAAVQELDPYGVNIEKFECVNHVSKRLGGALLNASKQFHLGGKGEGTLTKDKIIRLAHYFGKAIKQETTVDDMKNAIYSTLKHCKSTDSHPQHSNCPDGEQSWCFYKRAVANNQPIPSHKEKMHTYLKESVVAKIMPVYMRLANSQLLEKCKGDTQNNNESLHNVIWSMLPKRKFFSLRRMLYCTYRAVVRFNHGHLAAATLEGTIGMESKKVLTEINKRRVSSEEWREDKKEESRKRKIRFIQEEEKLKAREGETYGPGIAPLP